MPRWIVRLAPDEYVEWSTVVDAPVSYISTRDEAVKEWGLDRVVRADRNVTSAFPHQYHYGSVEEFVSGNRAGDGETELSLTAIRHEYASASADPPRLEDYPDNDSYLRAVKEYLARTDGP